MFRFIPFLFTLLLFTQCTAEKKSRTDSSLDISQIIKERTLLDFSKTREQVRTQLNRYYPALTDSQIDNWEKSGHLEMRLIDGEKRYFKYAVSNLFRLDTAAARVRYGPAGPPPDPLDSICLEKTAAIIQSDRHGIPVETSIIKIEYTITVDAGAVPAGEKVSCWMPFPSRSKPRQQGIRLISCNTENPLRSSVEHQHSSIYAEKIAIAGLPTIFSYMASFEISGQWFDPERIEADNHGVKTGKLKKYTQENLPHIAFTPSVRQLADSLSCAETNPLNMIRSFYYWIDQNIPWASAREYSTFECIPDYVLQQRHGDCGMKTFLLMSMARYKGIPARWQSGWMLHPGEENLHDWCEIWLGKTGWVPVDMSFGLQKTSDNALKEFYLTGIDSYRMIVNDGFAGELDPPKKYYRSEPFDFQRGEVEWPGGNLYFNQWDYKLNVVSIEQKKL